MSEVKRLKSREYAIGWIAALSSERAAALLMLDEKHGRPLDFDQPFTDPNSYTWGRINEHNIVIASLSAGVCGTTSAAATALPMLSSFPQIRFGLMVGIGAGIPKLSGPDIRLGDVVVGRPGGRSGGVIQYDLGKTKPGAGWEGKDFLNKPPEVLLRALAALEADHINGEYRMAGFLADAVARKPKEVQALYEYPGSESDRLFEDSYNHVSGEDCDKCESARIIKRTQRGSTVPVIHYGLIASGNTLVRDPDFRKSVLNRVGEDCICLEMEAAGLMNHFPCLVIRGICDYADSHKNDRWQQYSAAAAAAFVKELLIYVPNGDVQKSSTAWDIMQAS